MHANTGTARIDAEAMNDMIDSISGLSYDLASIAEEERERLLQELLAENHKQRAFLERLIETVSVAIAVLHGPDHRYVLSNPEYDRLARTKAALLGRTVAEIWPELAAQVVPLLDHVYQTGERYQAINIPLMIERNGIANEEIFTFSYERLHDHHGMPEGILVIAYETTEHVRLQRQAETAAIERHRLEEGKLLLHTIVTAQEEERRRIARNLHDQFGQQLSALRLGLAALADTAEATHSETITRLQQIAAQLDQDLDRLALELRPAALDDLGLRVALQQHV